VLRRTSNETEVRPVRAPGAGAVPRTRFWEPPGAETIEGFLEGTSFVAESPDVQRLRRLAHAVARELEELRVYISVIDPAVQAIRTIRPLAEVEQEHIEHAVRVTRSAAAAARLLKISPATIYRKLGEYEAARRSEQRLRGLGAAAARRVFGPVGGVPPRDEQPAPAADAES
jgi:hypothetical protein